MNMWITGWNLIYDAVRNPINGSLEVYCFARDVSEERQKSISEFLMSHQYEEVMLINPNTGEPTRFVCGGESLFMKNRKRSRTTMRD